MNERSAVCACNGLSLTVSGEAEIVVICSCHQCQRRTGTVYSAHAFFPEEAVTIRGEHRTFTRGSESGRPVTFHFCPTCGSTVFWKTVGRPNSWGIALGAFAGQSVPPPTAAVWTSERFEWVPLPELAHSFARGATPPPDKSG